MPANECIPYYEPGSRITFKASAAITGKRFIDISATLSSDGNLTCAPATAEGKALGVSSFDVASEHRGTMLLAPMVVPITAAEGITAGEEVQVATGGKAAKLASGKAVGRALATVTTGNDCKVLLYSGH